MKRKKLLALLLAMVLALNVAITAGADTVIPPSSDTLNTSNPTTSNQTVKSGGAGAELRVKSMLRLPVLQIRIANPSPIIVNPYGMPYDYNDITGTDQIISVPTVIKNESAVGVKVKISPKAEPTGADESYAKVVTDELTDSDSETVKKIQLKMQTVTDAKDHTFAVSDFESAQKLVVNGGTDHELELDAAGDASGKPEGAYYVTGAVKGNETTWGINDLITFKVTFEISSNLKADIDPDN